MERCKICARQEGKDDAVVLDSGLWLARHSGETNLLGYLLLESRRHFLDLAQATDQECASYGPTLRALVAAIHTVVQPERVYTFTLGEVVPHFHVHIIPRSAQVPRSYRGRGILHYPLQPPADQALIENVCHSLRQALRRAEHAIRI